MTIKPNKNMSQSQYELLTFMQDHKMINSLAAEMLGCNEYTVARYRMGDSNFNMDKMKILKQNYKKYLQKKLASIKD